MQCELAQADGYRGDVPIWVWGLGYMFPPIAKHNLAYSRLMNVEFGGDFLLIGTEFIHSSNFDYITFC